MNNKNLQHRIAEKQDLARITALLLSCELPVSDLQTSNITFIISTDNENLIGCIGIEPYGHNGLLRSFAVDSNYRKNGIGGQLLDKILAFCKQTGISNLHLLTTTAEKYFEAKGFIATFRDKAPSAIKNSAEFSSICPSTSTYMNLKNMQ